MVWLTTIGWPCIVSNGGDLKCVAAGFSLRRPCREFSRTAEVCGFRRDRINNIKFLCN